MTSFMDSLIPNTMFEVIITSAFLWFGYAKFAYGAPLWLDFKLNTIFATSLTALKYSKWLKK